MKSTQETQDHRALIEEVCWDEAREAIRKAQPGLAEIIEERKLNKRHNLIRARYPYGSIVLKDGVIQVPNSLGEVVPLTHSTISTSLRDRLSYSVFPLGLITQNSMEVSREIDGRIITLQFFLPGVIMGLWESLDPPKSHYPIRIWTVTAGARFIFTLPKIQAAAFFTRLRKEFDLPNQIPKEISQQWSMFRQIANHPNFTQPWYSEIYFFPAEWIERDSKSNDWIRFHHFLLQKAWSLSQYARNARNQDVIWDYFARILSEKGYKPNPLNIEIFKHIIAIAMGGAPGIKAAGISSEGAPVQGFHEVLINIYNLKNYVPTIMHPYPFSMDNTVGAPVYYSYQVNNILTSLPASRGPASTINELMNLHELLAHLLEEANSDSTKIENTYIADMVKKVAFTFYHSDITEQYSEIQHTSQMPKDDPALIQLEPQYGERKFAESAHFIRGCVRISRKK